MNEARLVANASVDNTLFIKAHMMDNHTTCLGYEGYFKMTKKEICEVIAEAFNHSIKPTGSGVWEGPRGTINLHFYDPDRKYPDILNISLDITCDTLVMRELISSLNSLEYEPKAGEGNYTLEIKHYYMNHKGCIARAEHRLTTDQFDHLSPALHPMIDIPDLMEQYSDSNESILILFGPPGTGKTCLAKMIMAEHSRRQEDDIEIVYVKDAQVLSKDAFWASMYSLEPDIIILDDLDNELLPRSEGKNDIVSNILSYSDGIFESKTKIIITTNLTNTKIDGALVRPGRAFDVLCLPILTKEQALSLWMGEFKGPIDEFNTRFEDMENISQAAIISEFQRWSKSRTPTYLRDASISVRKLVEDGGPVSI